MLAQKITPPTYLKLLVELFEGWNICTDAMLADAGINTNDLVSASNRLTLQQEANLFEQANKLSPVPEWALLIGQSTSIHSHGVYGYATLTCSTLEQALRIAGRFIKIAGCPAQGSMHVHRNGDYEILVTEQAHKPHIHRCTIEEFISSTYSLVRELVANTITPKAIYFDYPAPDYQHAYKEFFDCPVYFDANNCGIIIGANDLATRLPTWNPNVQKACEKECEQILMRMKNAEGFIDSVRRTLLSQPCDRRGADFVAKKLNMSSRNLRRKLEQEGTSYQVVLDDVRAELAKDYLGETQLRLDEISELLGFSETSNLRRAFKKWTGFTPREFRTKQLNAAL